MKLDDVTLNMTDMMLDITIQHQLFFMCPKISSSSRKNAKSRRRILLIELKPESYDLRNPNKEQGKLLTNFINFQFPSLARNYTLLYFYLNSHFTTLNDPIFQISSQWLNHEFTKIKSIYLTPKMLVTYQSQMSYMIKKSINSTWLVEKKKCSQTT